MGYKAQSPTSPLRRIMLARGYNMLELSVLSGCSPPTLRKLDRLDRETIGGITLRSILKVSLFLECSPSDLVPFLATTARKSKANVKRHSLGGAGRPKRSGVRSLPLEF